MLPLLLIFVAEMSKAILVLIIPQTLPTIAIELLFLTLLLQVVFAPIQGAISDHFCRKKSLLIAFSSIALSQILIFSSTYLGTTPFFIGLLLFAILGNGEPIARAIYVDLNFHKERRTLMGWSLIAQIAPWIFTSILYLSATMSHLIFFYYFVISILSISIISLFIKDLRDLDPQKKMRHVVVNELKSSIEFFKRKRFYLAFLGFLFFELSLSVSFYYSDVAIRERETEAEMIIFFFLGFIFGVFSLLHLKISDKWAIMLGLTLGLIGFLVSTLVAVAETTWLEKSLGYFICEFGSGIAMTGIFTYLSKGHFSHEQGKLFGILDSIQTVGEMTATAILILSTIFTPLTIGLITSALFVVAITLFRKNFQLT